MTPNPKPSLHEQCEAFLKRHCGIKYVCAAPNLEAFAQEIEAEAFRRGRLAGLEEAAVVADGYTWSLAYEIRDLKEKK